MWFELLGFKCVILKRHPVGNEQAHGLLAVTGRPLPMDNCQQDATGTARPISVNAQCLLNESHKQTGH